MDEHTVLIPDRFALLRRVRTSSTTGSSPKSVKLISASF